MFNSKKYLAEGVDWMVIENVKMVIQADRYERSGVIIYFKSNTVLKTPYVCVFKKGVEKYFSILSVESDIQSDLLFYKAVDCGYGVDRISKDKDLDIREVVGLVVTEIVDEGEILEIRKRNSYT